MWAAARGEHVHAAALENVAEVVGLDLERESLAAARDDYEEYIAGETDVPVTFLSGTRSGSPFEDGAFDVVCCTEVLSSTSPTTGGGGRAPAGLRAGGTLAVSVPRAGPRSESVGRSRTSTTRSGAATSPSSIARELRAAIERRGFRRVDGHFAHALHALLVAQVSLAQRDERGEPPLPLRAYDRFLEWDVMESPRPVRLLEAALDPVLGKSVVSTSSWRAIVSNLSSGSSLASGARARGGLHRARAAIGRARLWYPDGPADPGITSRARWGSPSAAATRPLAARTAGWPTPNTTTARCGRPTASLTMTATTVPTPVTSAQRTHRSAYVAVGAWHHHLCTEGSGVPRGPLADRPGRRRVRVRPASPDRRGLLDRRGRRRGLRGRAALQLRLDLQESGLRRGRGRRTRSRGAPRSVARGPNPPRRGDPLAARPVRPHLESKSRYAMDWFYPRPLWRDDRRFGAGSARDGMGFLEAGLGCRCVSDEPWVTVAESCELVVSLAAVGRTERARVRSSSGSFSGPTTGDLLDGVSVRRRGVLAG